MMRWHTPFLLTGCVVLGCMEIGQANAQAPASHPDLTPHVVLDAVQDLHEENYRLGQAVKHLSKRLEALEKGRVMPQTEPTPLTPSKVSKKPAVKPTKKPRKK